MPPHGIWAPATLRRRLLAGAGPRAGYVPIRVQSLRHATTATKKKTAHTAKKAKQAGSTKAAVPTPAPAKKTAGPGLARTAPVQTNTPAAAPMKNIPQVSPSPVKAEAAAQPKVKAAHPTPVAPAAKPKPPTGAGAAAVSLRAAPVKAATAPQRLEATAEPLKTSAQAPTRPSARVGADTASKEYKRAQWSYTGAVVGVPLLLVTSYFLYDRLILGNERLDTSRPTPTPIQEPVSASEDGA